MSDANRPPKSSSKSSRPSPKRERPDGPRERSGRGSARTMLPYRNVRALIAYYTGVFSAVPGIGLLLAPVATVFGILGYRYGRANPTAEGTGHAAAGIVFAALGTLLNLILLGLLVMYMLRLAWFAKK
jgi:hypothetical protein